MLRDAKQTDELDFARWISDKHAVKFSLSAFQPDRDRAWVHKFVKHLKSDTRSWFQVIEFERSAIGYCGLSKISAINKSAEYFILIGDQKFWNKGLGTRSGKEVLDYGFNSLGLNRIWLTVSECHPGAVRSYEKLGFKQEGIMRDACFRDGEHHNKIVMGILKTDYMNI